MTQPENPLVNLGTDLGNDPDRVDLGVDITKPKPKPDPDPRPEPTPDPEPTPATPATPRNLNKLTLEERKERWRQECESAGWVWNPDAAAGRGACSPPETWPDQPEQQQRDAQVHATVDTPAPHAATADVPTQAAGVEALG